MAPDVEKTDTYPVKIDRNSVRPGTVYYDPNGHVLLVYAVESNGLVRMIDGHTDYSLTYQFFAKFARGSAKQGGGFRNFRPLVGSGDDVQPVPNSQLSDLSSQQYQQSNFHKWVRKRLSQTTVMNPVNEFRERLEQLCVDIKDREKSVVEAVSRELHSFVAEAVQHGFTKPS